MTHSSGPNADDRLSRWVREHGQAVFGFLYVRVHDRHAAEDLVQEVFLRAWQARERYEDQGHERGYLLRIADRLACDRLRGRRPEQLASDEVWSQLEPDDPAEPDVRLLQDEQDLALRSALDRLTEPQRRTLLLRYFGNLEFQEIASMLGCPLNTALSHAHRGLTALRRWLERAT